MPDILVTICARGGSKGVKGKNLVNLDGKPLIYYTIKQALEWGKANDVVVSTDSKRIAAAAKRYGGNVPFLRPAAFATDSAPKLLAIRHALLECERIYKKRYQIVVDLDPTSPVRITDDLDACLEEFLRSRPSTLFTVVASKKNPYFNMVEIDANGKARLCKHLPSKIHRRQDAPKVYEMNASIYVYDRDYLARGRNLSPITHDSIAHIMRDESRVDIDNEIDLRFIEFLIEKGFIAI